MRARLGQRNSKNCLILPFLTAPCPNPALRKSVICAGCFTGEPIFIVRSSLSLEKELQKAATGKSGLSPDAGRGAPYAEDEGYAFFPSNLPTNVSSCITHKGLFKAGKAATEVSHQGMHPYEIKSYFAPSFESKL